MSQSTKQDVRPSWDDYFMSILDTVKERSTCVRRKVGAIIVKDKRIIATGYNGAPSGLKHCYELGCMRERLNIPSGQNHELCRGIHAEQNAIIQAAMYGVSINEATIYVTCSPCVQCAKMIINSGIKRVVYCGEYPDKLSEELLNEAGINLQKYTKNE